MQSSNWQNSNWQNSNRRLTSDTQWQAYKKLELISDALPNPSASRPGFKFGLDLVWRTLIVLLVDELVDPEQQAEYLDRCWALADFEQPASAKANTLQRLWLLIE